MPTIRRFPFVSHATSSATRVVVRGREGRLDVLPAGSSFWFRPLGTTLSEVPLDDLEFGQIFRVITADRQEVSVQTAMTARLADPERAARRLDFAVDLRTGRWTGTPLQTIQNRLAESAQQFAAQVAAITPMQQLLDDGLRLVREAITDGLAAEGQFAAVGVEVVGVRVIAIRADEELERALQTEVRERAQAEADRATYDRRAQAVDRERAIKENELNNHTELARREAELVELQGANERRRTQQELERERLRAEAELAAKRLVVDARVDEVARVADAENAALQARLAAYSAADLPAVLAAIAPQVIAALPEIDSLTLTPDTIGNAVSKVLAEVRA
ncbi:MAG: SPFH domain-containing protein [Propionibacteriaceae bacterium]|nr:SPFH domain-containing protein [Propionibacteriaceae bacterium]